MVEECGGFDGDGVCILFRALYNCNSTTTCYYCIEEMGGMQMQDIELWIDLS